MSRTVLYNGKVYVERGCYAQAILQEDGIILQVGSNKEVLAAAGDAERIDCQGKTVIPGFNDSHQHLFYMGRAMFFPDLTKAQCAEDLTKLCQEYLQKNPESKGFSAAGWNEETWAPAYRRKPDKRDLDKVSEEIPIVLTRICAHACCVNSYVLQRLGIDREHAVFDGAGIEVDEGGEPTGILTEKAFHAALDLVPNLTREELKLALTGAMKYAVSRGLTTVQSNDIGYVIKDQEACCSLMKEVYDEGKGLLRYTGQMFYDDVESLKGYCESPQFGESYADDWFRRGPLKLLKDGSLGARTAMLGFDYLDDPGNRGVEVNSDAYMQKMIDCAHDHGMQVVVHAIGDEAIRRVIRMYDEANGGSNGENPLRHSLIHCQITDGTLLAHIKASGLLVAYQPIFLQSDMYIVPSRCGDEMMKTSYAFRTAAELGIHASYGTDCPVEDLDPLACIYCAVTRKDLKGQPEDGFYAEECVDVETAVDAYTLESAYHEFREDVKGRLKTGYYADLVVLDRDIFTCKSEEILGANPVLTMVGGKIVYRAE